MKVTQKNILYSTIICCLMLAPACLKQKYHKLSVSAALLERHYYQPGTYWIMKDSISGRVDSFFITSATSVNIPIRKNLDIQNVNMEMAQISQDGLDTTYWKWSFSQSTMSLKILSRTYPQLYYYCGVVRDPVTTSITFFPMNSRYYADVAESNMTGPYDTASPPSQYSNWLYINQSEGLVKMRINYLTTPAQRYVWELQRQNLVL